MAFELRVSIFCPHFNNDRGLDLSLITYQFIELLPIEDKSLGRTGALRLIFSSPTKNQCPDKFSILMNTLETQNDKGFPTRWTDYDNAFCSIAFGKQYGHPIIELNLPESELMKINHQSLAKKPIQLFKVSFDSQYQVDDGFTVSECETQLVSNYEDFLHFGYIKSRKCMTVTDYESLTGCDAILNWAETLTDTNHEVKDIENSYQKMRSRFI